MLCQICGKNPATVHFTEIHDNRMSEIHVCERCAEEKGMQASASQHKFEIADLLASMVDAVTQTDEERVGHVQCPRCGMLYSSFKATGRLGCAECYRAFEGPLRDLLRRLHGSSRHLGERYAAAGTEEAIPAPGAEQLRQQLQLAIDTANFELAAELRDRLRTFGGAGD